MDFAEKPRGSLPELGFREYVEALEVERQKVEVFQRELPLCLELVTQTIERCRQQLSSGAAATTEYLHGHQSEECNSEQTSSGEHHVFEEFIPLKRTCSSDANHDEDEDEQEHESPADKSTVGNKTNNNNNNNNKEDWLRSVQLWNDPTADPPPQQQEDSETKALATEVRKNGGGFQPFQREKGNEGKSGAPASDPAASSSGGGGKREAKEGQRKQRRNWSPELHKRFVNALQQLGGSHAATPKQIREFMKVDGLTNDEVKSHLQKYRLHTRRPAQAIPSNGGAQTPQVVFVGGIWVQPTDYAAAVSGDPSSSGIYAPVAAHPHGLHRAHHHKRAEPASTHSSVERAAASHVSSEGARRHSNSPATSSSTHTTTTSHAF